MGRFSADVISLAQQTEQKYGVPASVTLAQYALESGYGTSKLATQANNYFGITGKNYSTGKFIMMNGRTWSKYDSMSASFDDHGRLLSTDLYANAHHNTTDPYLYIDAISEIYAPSSDGNSGYAETLKQIIEENNLTQYDSDSPVVHGGSGGTFGTTVEQTASVSGWSSVLGKIVKFIALLAITVLGAVFFFSAFEWNPVKKMKKVVEKDGG